MLKKKSFLIVTLSTAFLPAILALGGCASPKVINNRQYLPYGLMTGNLKSPDVEYKLAVGNLIIGSTVMFLPTLNQLYTPVGPKATSQAPQDGAK